MAFLKILFLEDDAVSAFKTADDLAAAQAEADLSIDLVHVETLADARDRLSRESFDVVLSDLTLSDSRGPETIATLNSLGHDTPIVALTADETLRQMYDCMYAGADAYLLKGHAPPSTLVRAILQGIERRQMQTRVCEAEAMSKAVIESVDLALITINQLGCIKTFNRAAERMFGYKKSEIVGENVLTLIPKGGKGGHEAGFREYVNSHDSRLDGVRRDVDVLHKSGTKVPVALTIAEMINFPGGRRFCATLYDTTEEKQRSTELLHAYETAQAATLAKDQFLANMSHEIRTPMTAILGYAELLLGEEGLSKAPPERVTAFRAIKRNGDHLLSVINDILDVSKIEAGKIEVEQIPSSLAEITHDAVAIVQGRADAKGLPLRLIFDTRTPEMVLTDPTRVRQILVNLIGNAIKFTESGEVQVRVAFRAENNRDFMEFNIIDSGIGMTPEQLGRLFQPFTQADTSTTRKFGGTGLGLVISKRLAEILGGGIEVKSQLGEGSTFCVTLSAGKVNGAEMVEPEDTLDQQSQKDQAKASKAPAKNVKLTSRVLVAEDGPDNQRLISFLLKKAGAEVQVVENGQEAFEKAMEARENDAAFDVILMDMQMPVMDGYTATGQLREVGYDGPIIALTAHAMAGDRDKCLAAGCDDYATKPLNREKLIGQVSQWHGEVSPLAKKPEEDPSAAPEFAPKEEAACTELQTAT